MTPGAIAGLLSRETAKGQDPSGLTGLMATNGHVSGTSWPTSDAGFLGFSMSRPGALTLGPSDKAAA